MRATPIDWDKARAVLEQVSTVGRAIFFRLDAEVTRVESAVVQAGEHTEASVVASTSLSWIVSAVIALAGMGILFALRAYLHEYAERREAQRRIAHAALHDELTGLPNRRLLLSRLGEVTRRGDPAGLLLLRLARYRTVVAGLGHRAAGRPPLLIAVNVSARQCVQSGFVDEVAAVLGETGYPPHWLELEITESVAAQDAEATVTLLAALKALGVRLAIDDFGTGFSSLSYLRRFPIDKLKVDQSFVRGLPEDGQSAAIARTVIALGRELSLTVIAEGVETEAQEAWLVAHGCHELQGFRYSRPLPAGEFDRWRAAMAVLSYAPAA